MAIPIPYHPQRRANLERGDDHAGRCAICGKGVRNVRWMVHIINGGLDIKTDEKPREIDEAGNLYHFPIGSDCLKRHPQIRPWAIRVPPDTGADNADDPDYGIPPGF